MNLPILAVTAITNFVLACEAYFICGLLFARPKKTFSAAWYWQLALFALACSALLGGIDHGFLEVYCQPAVRKLFAHVNWALIGFLTFLTFRTTSAQFFLPAWQRFTNIAATIQLLAYLSLLLFVDDYLLVILNYAPVLLLLLGCNVFCSRNSGSWAMTTGIVLTFIASGIQASSFAPIGSLDNSSFYHFGIMVALIFFYKGGLNLKGFTPTA